MKTIYLAGPDVFIQRYPQQKIEIRAMCAASGLTLLLPGDLETALAGNLKEALDFAASYKNPGEST